MHTLGPRHSSLKHSPGALSNPLTKSGVPVTRNISNEQSTFHSLVEDIIVGFHASGTESNYSRAWYIGYFDFAGIAKCFALDVIWDKKILSVCRLPGARYNPASMTRSMDQQNCHTQAGRQERSGKIDGHWGRG
jgi:hypothetical protein